MVTHPLNPCLRGVVEILDRSPLIQSAVVFGSCAARPGEAFDIDMAFVLDEPYSSQAIDRYRRLLRAGAYGTPRYGRLDLFIAFSDGLWVRNENCLGFTRAKNASGLRKAIDQGVAWPQWRAGIDLEQAAPPMKEEPRKTPGLRPA